MRFPNSIRRDKPAGSLIRGCLLNILGGMLVDMKTKSPTTTIFAARRTALATVLLIAALIVPVGCSSNRVTLRSVPKTPLGEELQLSSYWGPQPSPRTVQLLRIHNLSYEPKGDPRPLIAQLQSYNAQTPVAERVYAMGELAYLGGKSAEKTDKKIAVDLYGAAVLYAYQYLFDSRYAATRNPYDPQYRGACDLYNGALESGLRLIAKDKQLKPDSIQTINTADGSWDIECKLVGSRWSSQDIARFEFCSDYNVTGLKNQYRTHGLGVPMIAVRSGKSYENEPVGAKYYPPNLSFPLTAFLRPLNPEEINPSKNTARAQGVLELYDPLTTADMMVGYHRVPLESDLTTPLAYFLSNPQLDALATVGLLQPNALLKQLDPSRPKPIMGLYMVQPYEPGKIPVVLVHGLWSSPMTWMEMFNDLRSLPEIRNNYQFWFYLYPTGQPFWLSARDLRNDLAEVRKVLDPNRQEPALDQMVLVGHSMGGLISDLQTLPSGDDYWKLVSKEPLDQLKADPDIREKLRQTFYFEPNPSIRRVVTIGTPHRGSPFSKETTQWLLGKLINLPKMIVPEKIFRENPDAFVNGSLIEVKTSIDSLSPSSPILPVMLSAHRLPSVKYHNIVGDYAMPWYAKPFEQEGDGVVPITSAKVDYAASEITVPADHTTVHAHPAAVLEVRRILLEHLSDLRGQQTAGVAQRAMDAVR
jgi:pimeloyl-ACP methyl ester carboxylesterase